MEILNLKDLVTEVNFSVRLMSILEIVEKFTELQIKRNCSSEELRRKTIKNNEQNLSCSYKTIRNILLYLQLEILEVEEREVE